VVHSALTAIQLDIDSRFAVSPAPLCTTVFPLALTPPSSLGDLLLNCVEVSQAHFFFDHPNRFSGFPLCSLRSRQSSTSPSRFLTDHGAERRVPDPHGRTCHFFGLRDAYEMSQFLKMLPFLFARGCRSLPAPSVTDVAADPDFSFSIRFNNYELGLPPLHCANGVFVALSHLHFRSFWALPLSSSPLYVLCFSRLLR